MDDPPAKAAYFSTEGPAAVALVEAIQAGDVATLERLLAEHPRWVAARFGISCEQPAGNASRTLLHVATDWPGHFPNGPAVVRALIAAGADVNARFPDLHSETPLHWAASCDDVPMLDVLLDLGAEIEADGGVIANGPPIADAVAFGQWQAARRLVERGATTNLWQSAALGLMDRVEQCFASDPVPNYEQTSNALWCACHGGQQAAAEYLLARGALLNWIGYDQLTPLDAARRSGASELAAWLAAHGALSAKA